MGVLRDRMAVDRRLRGLSPVTQQMYLGCVERFVAYHRRSPAALGEAAIRAVLDHLVRERRMSRSTQRVYVAAIHFLYQVTLDRPVTVRRIPFPRRDGERLPEILSRAEVERLLRAPSRPNHCAMLMTLHGAGLRVGEVCALVPDDIDSQRMLIRVREGKGDKGANVTLPRAAGVCPLAVHASTTDPIERPVRQPPTRVARRGPSLTRSSTLARATGTPPARLPRRIVSP